MENIDDKYRKKNPYSVPDDYFESLTDQVMSRLEEKKAPRKSGFMQFVKPYLGLAAMFLLALMIVQMILPRVVDKKQMLVQDGEQIVQTGDLTESVEEIVFDSYFNPTNDEIIEYLALEVNSYELMYAGIY